MDSRTAAHTLTRIAALLELRGENRFKARAYQSAARAVVALDTDDIAPLLRSGELERIKGVGPVTLGVLRELAETGESRYLSELQATTPDGLLEMLRVPGIGAAKVALIHEKLGVATVDELEAAARDGRLTTLSGFGRKTAERVLQGIEFARASGSLALFHRAAAEGHLLLANVRRHPDVTHAELAGSLRRRREVVRDVDIVAACSAPPDQVAASLAAAPGVREASSTGTGAVSLRFVDGTLLDLYCVRRAEFAVALMRATGSAEHVAEMTERATARGLTLAGDELRDGEGRVLPTPTEDALYAALGLSFLPPELREGRGELAAASSGSLPTLVELSDIRGVLHCHSDYSDGTVSIAEMARAARQRGWNYLGITDHSQSAFYAGGLSRDAVLRQHEEIDALNHTFADFRLLKGIEADILVDGQIDYDEATLDRFEYVIGSVHSRFRLDERAMTERVLRAMDDPHLTILGHPTGRLLLTREPYAVDMAAVIEKAGDTGVVIELNADPHRLDLDWRLCRTAKERGILIEIGPDAHSPGGLDNVEIGVGIARKGWLEASDVLNTRGAADVLALAAKRRAGRDGAPVR